MRLQKVLCPIDFSSGSDAAMRVAIRIANANDAELVLAHAWYIPPIVLGTDYAFPAVAVQRSIDSAQRSLDEALERARGLGAKRLSSQLLTGLPWQRIVETAAPDSSTDLIVIGTHGRTGFARVLIGSVAEKVVRHAECPVMVVRPDDTARPFSHILCPIDFTDSSRRALALAGRLVEPGGGITLLHVVEAPVAMSGEALAQDFLSTLDRNSATLLEEWATQLRGEVDVPVVARTRLGNAGSQTLALLEQAHPRFDLVITGSHGRTGLRRALLGSVAEKIVRHAPCPVLVARAP